MYLLYNEKSFIKSKWLFVLNTYLWPEFLFNYIPQNIITLAAKNYLTSKVYLRGLLLLATSLLLKILLAEELELSQHLWQCSKQVALHILGPPWGEHMPWHVFLQMWGVVLLSTLVSFYNTLHKKDLIWIGNFGFVLFWCKHQNLKSTFPPVHSFSLVSKFEWSFNFIKN